jgi:hypothetical protein
VVCVHQFPHFAGIHSGLVVELGGTEEIVFRELLDHFHQDVYFVEELETVGE